MTPDTEKRDTLPVGKLPADLLAKLLAQAPVDDPRVLVKPGPGLDCAVVEYGDVCLVYKSDPITFATDEIGWYLVQVNANDIATTGAAPRWLLVTLLLPEGQTTAALVEQIGRQIYDACRALGLAVIGGHTEITYGLDRPVVVGTMVGEVERQRLVTPQGARPGDRLLLTKGVPIEATAILAREFAGRLAGAFSPAEIAEAQAFLTDPGISVLPEAQTAAQAGRVTAMHDPTEGGLVGALWELAEASGRSLVVDRAAVPIPPLSARLCRFLGLDPLAAIASGALLLAVAAGDAPAVRQAIETGGIVCAEIGRVEAGPPAVWFEQAGEREQVIRPERDEIARLFAGRPK
ncbi:MAG: AIR synthase family protein [Chloroflexi bacterium]|nr:AIR synthase family protein [Chloroflexota bacterium]MCI0578586.1 AIR synthase family protein [Chloroflexota bacterium]MCI0647345.1 AIR synthase family protein [Chloroflexota bacterium]MCI0727805.1 AIR synthase family protein [Chloroflexota bacterium]